MKVKVLWYDNVNDKSFEQEGSLSFTINDNIDFTIQNVIDDYENKGITIDQGQDDDCYEFDLPDWDIVNTGFYNDRLVSKLILDLETAIKNEDQNGNQ